MITNLNSEPIRSAWLDRTWAQLCTLMASLPLIHHGFSMAATLELPAAGSHQLFGVKAFPSVVGTKSLTSKNSI